MIQGSTLTLAINQMKGKKPLGCMKVGGIPSPGEFDVKELRLPPWHSLEWQIDGRWVSSDDGVNGNP